ncbi:MAG: hypothetical protein AAFN17_13180 [Pseudomonadota bacterium]
MLAASVGCAGIARMDDGQKVRFGVQSGRDGCSAAENIELA